jgi:hypothetical protein
VRSAWGFPSQQGIGKEHQAECEAASHPIEQADQRTNQPRNDRDQHDVSERGPCQMVQISSVTVMAERQPLESIEEEQ